MTTLPPFSIVIPPGLRGKTFCTVHVGPTYDYIVFTLSFPIFPLIQTMEIFSFSSYFLLFPLLPLKISQRNTALVREKIQSDLIHFLPISSELQFATDWYFDQGLVSLCLSCHTLQAWPLHHLLSYSSWPSLRDVLPQHNRLWPNSLLKRGRLEACDWVG